MKNVSKLFGVISIVALIALSLASCGDSGSGDNSSPGGDSGGGKVLWSVSEVATYLATAAGGNSVANAIPITVNIFLGTMTDVGSGWQLLLSVLQTSSKMVKLDLSNSSLTGTIFNPVSSISTGKSTITLLILPTTATSIITGTSTTTAAFRNFNNLTACSGINVTSIGNYAFSNCASLQSVDFPKVSSIGDSAFYGNTALQSVSIPAAQSIDSNAFSGCTILQKVSFPAVQSIGYYAFANCIALQNIIFPATVNISGGTFPGCKSLISFNLLGTGSLSIIEGGKALARNNTELVEYPSASGTITMSTIISIGGAAFRGCTTLQSASFPAVTSIGGSAFAECTALQNVSFPLITSIAGSAFNTTGNTNLTITMGNTAPTVGQTVFYGVTSKFVTIKVPVGSTSYNTTWQNSFKGGNSNIFLSIVYE